MKHQITLRISYNSYQFDECGAFSMNSAAPAVPEHTLKVFGLSENQTVQDAVLGFQKTHPDVKVEFQTSGKSALHFSAAVPYVLLFRISCMAARMPEAESFFSMIPAPISVTLLATACCSFVCG